MAKAATKKPAATGKAMVNWDEELAKQAAIAAKMEENVGGGQWFSVRGGVLSWNDSPLPGNQMAVVILDHQLENVFYEHAYNPDVVAPPLCFAIGRSDDDLEPHATVVERGQEQNATCEGCPMNAWGTADKGRGKACRNTRRLALIPAGSFDANGKFKSILDEDHISSTQIGLLKLPLTSVKGFASYVKQLTDAVRRPPRAMITRVRVTPDPKNQFAVTFEPISNVPNELMSAIMERVKVAETLLDQPYNLDLEEQAVAKPARRGAPAKGAKGKAAANQRPPVKKAAGGRKY